jgi:hypothetical protein
LVSIYVKSSIEVGKGWLVSIYVKSSIEVGKGWFVNIYCMSRAALRLEKAGW